MHPTLPIKQSLALLLICLAAPANAINLGDLQMQSYLGQRFKGSVNYQLSPSETSLADCITVSPASGDAPYIGSSEVQIRPKGDGNTGTILISSNQSIGEPVVALKLSIQCGNQQLSREFTVFLDPAPDIVAPTSLSEKHLAMPNPARFQLRPEARVPTAKKDTTLADVAARYYPADSAQYQIYLNRLKRANPNVATTETLISAGSPLFVPPRPKLAPAKIVADAPRQETGQLRLEDADAMSRPASAPLNAQQNPEAYAKALEEKIVTLTELKKRLQLELADLDLKMAQMQLATANAASAPAQLASAAVIAAASSAASTVAVSSSVKGAPKVAVLPVASTPVRVQAEAGSSWSWAWLLLAVGGVGGLLWWRRKMQLQAERWANEDINDGVDLNRSIMSIIQAKVGHTMAQSPSTVMSLFGANPKSHAGFELKEELDDHLDQAQYFLAQGETLKAIELLYAAIDEQPEDTERWLMLFRVFRQQMMKTEYSALAHRFKALHKDEGDWELIRSIGNKLDPENLLFIRNIERAERAPDKTTALFDTEMAAAAPVVMEIKPDFTVAPVLPDFEADATLSMETAIESALTADASLMDFLQKETEPEEAPPRLPETENNRPA